MFMKNFTLLFLSLFFVFSAAASIPTELDVEPSGINKVSKIDVISISYTKGNYASITSYANPKIYVNGTQVAVTYKNVSDTEINYILTTPITASGEYTISIPAATFWYDDLYETDNPEMSWKVTVEANEGGSDFKPIDNAGASIEPVQGTYNSLHYFTITINESFVSANSSIKPYLIKDDGTNTVVANGKSLEGAGLANGNIDLEEAVTTPGKYVLVVPAGAFYSYLTDEDYPEYRFRYVINVDSASPDPVADNVTITPAPGSTIESLDSMVVKYNDYNSIYTNKNNTQLGEITVTNATGAVVAKGSPTISATGLAPNEVKIDFVPAVTAPGEYVVNIPARSFVVEGARLSSGCYTTAQQVSYTVVVPTGINAPRVDVKSAVIYRVDGTRVEACDVNDLPKGFYIVNGRKIVKR